MKDIQQLRIIEEMVNDLNMNIEIVPVPTVREPSGLALSSRNTYLSAEEREKSSFHLQIATNGKRSHFGKGGHKHC